jgi:hypothetical protein
LNIKRQSDAPRIGHIDHFGCGLDDEIGARHPENIRHPLHRFVLKVNDSGNTDLRQGHNRRVRAIVTLIVAVGISVLVRPPGVSDGFGGSLIT